MAMRGGLHAKVFAVIALVAVSLVLGLTAYFSHRYEEATRHELDDRLRLYTALAARELEPVVSLDDEQTARDIFDALAVDEELSAVAVYRADGSLIASHGELGLPFTKRESKRIASRERDGATGLVELELSTRLVDAEISAADSRAFGVALIFLVLGLGSAWLIARHLANRIGAVASAAFKIAESSPAATPLVVDDSDEIGRLSDSFNTMLSRLLAAQNREIELILAHADKGFVIVDRSGNMGEHHSAVMDRWFDGAAKKDAPIWSLFTDTRLAATIELAWEGLFEEFLPSEVAIEQFPKRFRQGALTFELTVHPIRNDEGGLESALVTLSNVTDALLRDENDATRGDLVALCERALADRASVIDFVNEGDSLHRAIEIGETLVDLRRAVHTLKGVAAQAGATHISRTCDTIEVAMAESENGAPKPSDIAALSNRWLGLTNRLRLLFSSSSPQLYVTRADVDSLLASIASFEPHALLARKARLLTLEPMQIRLDRIKDSARALGLRLGKDLEVTGSAYGLRCDPEVWTPFWSVFNHVVRNALDHGIEGADIRIAHGKSGAGHLSIDVMRRKENVVIEVMEDGAGIDWDAIAKRARTLGLPAETRRDLELALFADGLSTCHDATEISGRGLGLASVRAITERMGGAISVVSMRGVGTTLRFTFPAATLGAAYAEEETRVAA